MYQNRTSFCLYSQTCIYNVIVAINTVKSDSIILHLHSLKLMIILLIPYEKCTDWCAPVPSNVTTDHSLYSKHTYTTSISRYISTSDGGVGGGSGALATV